MRKSALLCFWVGIYVCLVPTALVADQSSGDTLSQEKAYAIVKKLYKEKLGRDAEPEGLELHAKLLLEEGKDENWLATALGDSPEGQIIHRSKVQTRLGVVAVLLGSLVFLLLIWFFRKSKRAAWLSTALYIVWIVLLVEAAVRLYFTAVVRVDFFHPEDAVRAMLLSDYVLSAEQQYDEKLQNQKGCRVLLLGASVLDPHHGGVPQQLRSYLNKLGAENVEIFNYARAAHSSHDSRFKYLHLLKDYQFDVVVVYHAINEVRANNCPEEIFREDYAHYSWYEDINIAERHLKSVRLSVIPYIGDFLYHRLRQQLAPHKYIPIGEPSPEWMGYGATIKTAASFKRNMEDIIETARSRSAQVVLMTFATYLAPSYSREAYEQKKLDYVGRGYAVELWGEPSNVLRGVDAHNNVIRELAAQNSDVLFLDMENIMPKKGKYFTDICHLSYNEGSKSLAYPLADLLVNQCEK